MALEFLLLPPPFCFAKSVFHSHIPEIWRGSAVCYFLCVYMAPLIVGFLKKVNNLQEGWSSIFPSWKMLSAGRAKNKGRILRQDLPLYTIFLFIFFFLYTLSFCSYFSVRTGRAFKWRGFWWNFQIFCLFLFHYLHLDIEEK